MGISKLIHLLALVSPLLASNLKTALEEYMYDMLSDSQQYYNTTYRKKLQITHPRVNKRITDLLEALINDYNTLEPDSYNNLGLSKSNHIGLNK